MNEIAAKLGEVGLPGADQRAGQADLGRRDRRRRPQRPDRGRLPRQGRASRSSCSSGASGSAAPARSSARSPNQGYSVSPCAYVVGLLDELVIDELQLKQRGFECYVADPNLWVPFEDGTSFGQWLDDAKTQANLEALKVSQGRHRRLLGLRAPLRRDPPAPAHPRARHAGSATRRPARRSRTCCTASRRCSTSSSSA